MVSKINVWKGFGLSSMLCEKVMVSEAHLQVKAIFRNCMAHYKESSFKKACCAEWRWFLKHVLLSQANCSNMRWF